MLIATGIVVLLVLSAWHGLCSRASRSNTLLAQPLALLEQRLDRPGDDPSERPPAG